jgi:sec-independent protein translocase protein TatB
MPTILLFLEFIGTTELLVIGLVALIIFGPRKLPEIGRTVGKSLAEFKRASEDFKRTWEYEVETERRQVSARVEPGSTLDELSAAETDPAYVDPTIHTETISQADPVASHYDPIGDNAVEATADAHGAVTDPGSVSDDEARLAAGPVPSPLAVPRGAPVPASAPQDAEASFPAELSERVADDVTADEPARERA